MNRLRAWIRSFFGFSRSQTNGFLVLIPLMIVVVFSEPMYRNWFVRQPHDYSKEGKELDSAIATMQWSEPDSTDVKETTVVTRTSFNPNTATKE